MKKFILLFGIVLICSAVFGQRKFDQRTLTMPYDTDSVTAQKFFSGNSWSVEFNASELDGVDTMYVYGTANSDTTEYALIWVDQDLDGTNDNPWTLSTTTNLVVWGDSWPFRYIIYKLAVGTSTGGLPVYVDETKQ